MFSAVSALYKEPIPATDPLLYKPICSAGVVHHLVLSVPHVYHLIQQGKTWNDALAYCQANYDDLAAVESNDDLIRLQSEIQTQQFGSSAWVGLYNDVKGWRWSLGNEPVDLYMWAIQWGQPNYGNELCGGIDPWGWLDATCDTVLPFICFDGEERHCSVRHSVCSNCLLPEVMLPSVKDIKQNIVHGCQGEDLLHLTHFGPSEDLTVLLLHRY